MSAWLEAPTNLTHKIQQTNCSTEVKNCQEKEKQMGNRAIITDKNKKIGVYLHWNGGRDSVEGFLTYCKLKEYKNPNKDCYGWARLCQVIGNYFGGICSVGIDTFEKLDTDNGDNGTYIIDENWDICGRKYFDGIEQQEYDLFEFIKGVNSCMPETEQLEETYIRNKINELQEAKKMNEKKNFENF